jgi:hypothetical protein
MRRTTLAAAVLLTIALGTTAKAQAASAAGAASAAVKPERPLNSISCPATTLCMAVGEDIRTNHAIAETFNGSRWSLTELPLPAGAKFATLGSIDCPTKTRCIAVGQWGPSPVFTTYRLYAETWNGKSWTRVGGIPAPSGNQGAAYSGVSCSSATSCVLTAVKLGRTGIAVGFTEILAAGKWHLSVPPGFGTGNNILENVSCTSATHCVVVGNSGVSRRAPGGTPAASIIADTWNGRGWSEAKLPMPSGGRGAWAYDVSCSSATSCFVTGGQNLSGGVSGTLAERIVGGKWKITSVAGALGNHTSLFAVSCPTAAMCMATGGSELASDDDPAFADSWAGAGWLDWSVAAPANGAFVYSSVLTSVSCPTATHCVAVGLYGDVNGSAYTDEFGFANVWNGSNWRLVSTP